MATPRTPGAPTTGTHATVGRYELVAPIAAGALGELWRARIASGPEEGRVVAIRRIARTPALDAAAVERLTNAGFSAMELRHPKIAAVLDVVVADSEIAIVSEHIGGGPVTSILHPPPGKRANVTVPVALRIVLDVLGGLDAVREPWAELVPPPETEDDRRLAAGIHGGLVPDDVLIASFGETMLLEVGLAGVAMSIPAISDHAEVIAYRAPEQLEGNAPVDQRADVFTVGILAWELITARPLFGVAAMPRLPSSATAAKTRAFAGSAQVATVRRKVLQAPIQRLDSLPLLKGKVTPELAACVARCLERDPAARFQTIREALLAFEALNVAGPHDAVAKVLVGVTLSEGEEAATEFRPAFESNRPTVPPAGERDTAPPATRKAPPAPSKLAASAASKAPARPGIESIPASDDVESIAPGAVSGAPSARPESIPASSDVESLPPSGERPFSSARLGAESFPPFADDAVTLPPGSSVGGVARPAAALGAAGVPPRADAKSPSPFGIGLPKETAGFPPVPVATGQKAGGLPTPAQVEPPTVPNLQPFDASVGVARPQASAAAPGPNRKVVLGVIAAAALLALAGLLRMLLSGDPEPDAAPRAASTGAAPARSAPVRAAPVAAPPAPEAPPEQVPEAPPAAPEEAPTLAPEGAGSEAAPAESGGPKKPLLKKKPFRPTAI